MATLSLEARYQDTEAVFVFMDGSMRDARPVAASARTTRDAKLFTLYMLAHAGAGVYYRGSV